MISMIEAVHVSDNEVYVRAVVEDIVLLHQQTQYDPPEYGPALCEVSFELDEGQAIPEDEEEVIEYLEQLDLNWQVVEEEYDF